MLKWSWSSFGEVTIFSIGKNLIMCSLKDGDAEKVLEEGPWSINGSHLNLKTWSLEQRPGEVNLRIVEYWVQIQRLALYQISISRAMLIDEQLGRVIEVDKELRDGQGSWGRI